MTQCDHCFVTPALHYLDDDELRYPDWFLAFLGDRAIRKPSPHTVKTYRQDFLAIAIQLVAAPDRVAHLPPDAITKAVMQAAFAAYADTHEAASIRRCWSNWNTLCDFLYAGEFITGNPMPLIGRPRVGKTLPKGLGAETISELLRVIDADRGSRRRADWAERDRAIVLMAVLTGLRADELVRVDVGDIRPTDEGGVVHVHGKGNKDRRIPVEQALIRELEIYLESRAARLPANIKRRPTSGALAAWPATAPLFVGRDGQRITRGTLQYRVLRAFKKAGLNSHRAAGALVHGFRHTYVICTACDRVGHVGSAA